jgi:cell shape-determining protein MreC
MGIVRMWSETEIRYNLAGKEVVVGFMDDVEETGDGHVVVKNLKDDTDMQKKLTELKVDLQQKDDEVESLKKEIRNLRSQLSNLSIPPVAVLWTRP